MATNLRNRPSRKSPTAAVATPPRTHAVVIVGAGFAGLGMAIRLRQAGITDVVILERGDAVGGTWRDNQYPGAACDIPSHLYSYSFAPNPAWSRTYSGSSEILAYVEDLVVRFELASQLRFGRDVTALRFDELRAQWSIETRGGETFRACAVLMAQGPLSNASLPDLPGIERFQGAKIHSARWDHGYDFTGKRVAVIGTGASGVQIVPELVKQAAFVKVFQRTPGWVLPRLDGETPAWLARLFAQVPATQAAMREAMYWIHESFALGLVWNSPATRLIEGLARAHLRRQVPDRWMRRQLTPDYRIGCKRVLNSNDWYPALQAPNAKLITWPIATLSEAGIRTVEGIEHQADCIVFATGFDVCKTGAPFPVHGLGGRSLGEDWARGAQAFKSVNVSGYPNLFMTFGPNSGPGHNSALVYMEGQLDYALEGIRRILAAPGRILDVKPKAQAAHNADLQTRLAKTNWNSGCRSWYLTQEGFNATMYPGFATQYRKQMASFDEADYVVREVVVRA